MPSFVANLTSNKSPPDTAAARTHLREEGWCVVPDILNSDETAQVLSRLWKAKEASEKQGDPTRLEFLDPNASNVRVFYLMQLDEIFLDLIQHPTAIEMVKSVLGDDFLISNFTANIARPGSKSMGLHSDMALVVPDPWKEIWALNVIWCLTDMYFENGATLYIPGSNKWEYESQIPTDARKLLKPFTAKAGSIVIMDGRVWHTSGENTSKEDRALLFGYYTAPFLRQQVNWTAKLDEITRENLSDDMKNWLGLGVNGNLGRALDLKYLDNQFPNGS
ncbi:hypothetical protein LTR10_013626 [Elasticomyces elasticus]|uniref:Phytanoyl-CoA dioxygenase n=1 Tax=Exophiala sideris TaxID=1016849 RepID=A0ABR0JQA4_9EURO|nr:hypothetical protein LTR10_013626 [Elasticomyces elasticus]KAK5039764.1 hypothetical protein LTS07_000259 [Exophiala sideris]KAK5041316.1 hypothetical protein LTR13_002791 [Exophiala sideris]KAK5068143.1 hypothetical protein LTR69_000261 [Exophiala sideris]KAK5187444.1 hypothetical protein LTR44_000260 [Eurotiomycetes sp. CCFEE 6388]